MGEDNSNVSNMDILCEIRNLKKDFANALALEVKKIREEFNEELKKTKNEVQLLVHGLESQVNFLTEKVIHLEAHGRRLNVIINNVEESKNENTESVIREIITKTLEIPAVDVNHISFRDVHRLPLSKKTNQDASNARIQQRPIIVAFTQQADRNMVMQKAHLFRNTNYSIKTDLPKQWDDKRNELLQLRRRLINEGKMVRVVERSYKPVLQVKKGEKWINY